MPGSDLWVLYHCPFQIRLCSEKRGHGRLGRVETGLLSRTLHIRPKGADCSTLGERRLDPLLKSKSKRLLVLADYTTIHGAFFRRAEKTPSAGMQITICDPFFSFSFRGILRCGGLEPSELGFARRFRCHRPQVRPLCVDCS